VGLARWGAGDGGGRELLFWVAAEADRSSLYSHRGSIASPQSAPKGAVHVTDDMLLR
jgi:hypothetical protein